MVYLSSGTLQAIKLERMLKVHWLKGDIELYQISMKRSVII